MPDEKLPILEYRNPMSRVKYRVRTLGEELFKLSLLATLYVGYGLVGDKEKFADSFLNVALVVWGLVFAITILSAIITTSVAWWNDCSPDTRWVVSGKWRRLLTVLFLANIVLVVFTVVVHYSCPHGYRWANNRFGVAYSTNGGPCANGPNPRRGPAWNVFGHWYVYWTA